MQLFWNEKDKEQKINNNTGITEIFIWSRELDLKEACLSTSTTMTSLATPSTPTQPSPGVFHNTPHYSQPNYYSTNQSQIPNSYSQTFQSFAQPSPPQRESQIPLNTEYSQTYSRGTPGCFRQQQDSNTTPNTLLCLQRKIQKICSLKLSFWKSGQTLLFRPPLTLNIEIELLKPGH